MEAGFVVVRLPLDVCGFRPGLARDWHDVDHFCVRDAERLLRPLKVKDIEGRNRKAA